MNVPAAVPAERPRCISKGFAQWAVAGTTLWAFPGVAQRDVPGSSHISVAGIFLIGVPLVAHQVHQGVGVVSTQPVRVAFSPKSVPFNVRFLRETTPITGAPRVTEGPVSGPADAGLMPANMAYEQVFS